MNTSTLPQELMTNSLLHFESGVPIDDLHLRPEQRRRLARVSHVYWIWIKNPFLDAFGLFKQLVKGKYSDLQSEWHAAQKDKMLFDFIVEHVAGPSRKVMEARVGMVANKLMSNGMATDNGKDMAEGAKIAIKLHHLDQPESEQNDMNKVAFLPSVVVTDIREVDDTKENIDGEETKRIMEKYGGYVDEKRTRIEQKVSTMEAREVKSEESSSVTQTNT